MRTSFFFFKDICGGELIKDTCLVRVGSRSEYDQQPVEYFTLGLLPFPHGFDKMQIVYQFPLTGERRKFLIDSRSRLSNNRVVLILRTGNNDVDMVGMFREPIASANQCSSNSTGQCPCGNEECRECYDVDKTSVERWAAFEAVAFENNKTPQCDDPAYNALDFDSFRIETRFNNKRLLPQQTFSPSGRVSFDKARVLKTGEAYEFAMNLLPRLCFSCTNRTHCSIYFNDVSLQARSSVFANSKYRIEVFRVTAPIKEYSSYYERLYTPQLTSVHVEMIDYDKLSRSIQLPPFHYEPGELLKRKFLIEVNPNI